MPKHRGTPLLFPVLLSGLLFLSGPLFSQQYIADYTVAKEELFRNIPLEYINKARNELVFAYQHTSHGTHVSNGMFGLPQYKTGDDVLFGLSRTPSTSLLEFRDFALEDYAPPGVIGIDLSNDETAFIQTTRNYLDAPENATVNVLMWAWSRITDHDVAGNYMPGMDSLINEYGPGGTMIGTGAGQREIPVTFVYMTGHSVKDDNVGPLKPRDQAAIIVDYCKTNQFFCHDYYSIDTHDMTDTYYEDTGDNGDSDTYGGNFLEDWQNSHTLGADWYENWLTMEGYVFPGDHTTQHITANRKSYAMWWILARIAGWDGSIDVSSITISADQGASSVMTGANLQMSAEVLPVVASSQAVVWSVIPGTGTATVSANGLLRGGRPGDVEVLATAMDGSGVADTMALAITDPLVALTSIAISTGGGSTDMDAGTTLQCSASVLPLDASNTEVIWSMINISGSALISADGLVMALTGGTVEAIATAEDGSMVADTIELTITGSIILVSDIEISSMGGVVEVLVGTDLQFTAAVLPEDASYPEVDWSVIDRTGSASITPEGLLSGLLPGVVDVVALAQDLSGVGDTMSVTITGNEVLVSSITVSTAGDVASMDGGASLQCSATVLPLDATNPSVEWSLVNGTGSGSITSGGLVTALSAGTIDVVATAMDGSAVSDLKSLTINSPDAVLNELSPNSLQLYPNPGSGIFYVESQQYNLEEIRVFDGNGREVLALSPSELNSKISIDLSGESPGIYGVSIWDSQKKLYFRKLVLVK